MTRVQEYRNSTETSKFDDEHLTPKFTIDHNMTSHALSLERILSGFILFYCIRLNFLLFLSLNK